jgi:hypothetical protein
MSVQSPDQRFESETPLEQIEAFLAALDGQGLRVDIEQRLRLNKLFLQLITERGLPDNPNELCRLITPILATSAAEQAICLTTFKSVFAGDWQKTVHPHFVSTERVQGRRANLGRQTWLTRRVIGVMVGFLVLVGFYIVFTVAIATRSITNNYIPGRPTNINSLVMDFD